ncbi:MAG: hypothetical protein EOR48_29125 [Mesorhizobium sp.]|nr:MAG: hypothetical protein EOR48_29125 [Mesorhizobium sp.]TIP43975.1 MAG: hypothetical protein E5X62_17060 [Mesorhizobium sp.]
MRGKARRRRRRCGGDIGDGVGKCAQIEVAHVGLLGFFRIGPKIGIGFRKARCENSKSWSVL